MKKAIIQLSLIVGISIVLGGIYNFALNALGSSKHLEMFVSGEDSKLLFPDAQDCSKKIEKVKKEEDAQQAPVGTPGENPGGEEASPGSTGNPEVKEPPAPPPTEEKTPRILIDEAFGYWEDDSLFVDARRTENYVKGHIPGAVSISPWETSDRLEKVRRLAEEKDLAIPVVVYCTRSKDCEDSEMISGDLKQVGFSDIMIFQGGFPVWQEKGKPITEGEEPGERPGQ